MHRPLFIVMIFLLLLRGWAGDAMATSMAAGQLQEPSSATKIVATYAHGARADGQFDHPLMELTSDVQMAHSTVTPADCAGHGAGQTSEPMSPEAAVHCESCAACQACHTVALSPLAPSTVLVTISPALPHSPVAQFASALTALGQKPPIS